MSEQNKDHPKIFTVSDIRKMQKMAEEQGFTLTAEPLMIPEELEAIKGNVRISLQLVDEDESNAT